MRFTNVHLENWRNFTRADVPLQQRMFLVGPNASGKSNFLDVIRFLRDLVSIGGGLEKAVADRGGVSRLRSLAARRYPEIVIDVRMGENDDTDWRYRIGIVQDNNSRPFLKEEKIWKAGKLLLERPDQRDVDDKELLRQTHLEQINSNRSFREIAEFFNTVQYYHIVPQLIRDPERSVGRKFDPFGGDFLEQIASSPKRTQESRLRRIQEALRVAVPQLQELTQYKDDRGVPHLRAKYDHWRSKGAWQTEADFSDGTLRLMGLLWALLDGNGPLILEEPELSLHAEVASRIPQMMASIQKTQRRQARQILVSTHSSDLLREPGIAPDEVLLLRPTSSGTDIEVSGDNAEIKILLDSGLPIAEAVLPHTRPPRLEQLSFFGNE
ncbi:MAG TPA: AAA family ATPase [Ktedonobacteraceae bacterium]|nr:AAA family ATPase [Ktedonobacteraceae bacterium]